MAEPPTVLITAVEPSADLMGAALVRALRDRAGSDLRVVGVGGDALAAEGLASLFDPAELAVLGLVEGLRAWPRARRRAAEVAALAVREQPDAAVLIDAWGFSLRCAWALRRACPELPLVKYVGPQVWASRPGRARVLAGAIDRLLAINPMDADFYAPFGLPVTFVGAPALARAPAAGDEARLRRRLGAGPGDPILLLLPGSRAGEVRRLLPVFAEAASRLVATRPALRLVMPVAGPVGAVVRDATATWSTPPVLLEDEAGKADAFAHATVALACSGTVTTELAMAGRPMVVAYRLSAITHALLTRLITTRYVTLFNVAADAEIAPELIQGACTGAALAAAVGARLDDPALRARQVAAQFAALDVMGRGGPDPSELAADAVAAMMGRAAAPVILGR